MPKFYGPELSNYETCKAGSFGSSSSANNDEVVPSHGTDEVAPKDSMMYDLLPWRDTISRMFKSNLLPRMDGRAADHLCRNRSVKRHEVEVKKLQASTYGITILIYVGARAQMMVLARRMTNEL